MKLSHRITLLITVLALLLAGFGVFSLFNRPAASVAAQFSGGILYTQDNAIWQWRDGNNRRISIPGKVRSDVPTDPNEFETQPAWSPDGSKFAYVRYGDSYSDIVVANADGSNVQRLTNDFSDAIPGTITYTSGTNWAFAPAWRPDGQRIVYLHDKGSDPLAVWIMASGGANLRDVRMTPAEITAVGWERPQWSPDSNSIIATCYQSGKAEIWVHSFDNDDSVWTALIKSDEADYDPAWSPDGKYIAYTAKVGGKTSIWVARADGSGGTQLIGNSDIDQGVRTPAWSPDGNAIAYLKLGNEGFDLYAVSLDTSGGSIRVGSPQQLTNDHHVSGTGGLSWGK